jgi:outer membrane protein
MPERTAAEQELNTFQKELEDVLTEMQNNLQTAMAGFEQLGADASEIKRNAKVAEIQDMQQRIQNYTQNAQGQIQQKNGELFKPIMDKAQNAIGEVAKEKGLLYVFEVNSLLFKSNESVDVLPLVKTKLGIQ